ncbi:ABC transporter ATP-binding protein [Actinomycetota bacterium]
MLQCKSLSVTYGKVAALDDVSLAVPYGNVVAVMGESGSGKTTLLRVIAGLVLPDGGSVSWGSRSITSEPAHLRRFGLMFQDYALFPHLSVGDNVAFGLRMRGDDAAKQRETTDRLLALVGLAGYEARAVAELSGGEQQRVALARTLAPEPDLVLLDEPLGALDRARRDQLLADMQRIFGELGVTALYVTHDHNEAFAIADDVVVLDAGRKVAEGTPRELWANPRHVAVATLLGFPVLPDVAVSQGRAVIGGVAAAVPFPDGVHHVAIPPGSVTVADDGPIPVEVHSRRFEDGSITAVVDLDGVQVLAIAPDDVAVGRATIRIDSTSLVVVDR